MVCCPTHHYTWILNPESWILNPESWILNPSPLSKHPSPLTPHPSPPRIYLYLFFFPATISYKESIWDERQLQCCVLIPFLTSFDFKFEWVSRKNKSLLTSSIVSGSDADASHLLCRMKMFGLEKCWFTLWKNFFSCKWQGYQMRNHTSMGRFNQWMLPHWINFSCNKSRLKATEILKKIQSNLKFVCVVSLIYKWHMNSHEHTTSVSVDSALATRTNTSASKQCLSIHRSRSWFTSIPGLK